MTPKDGGNGTAGGDGNTAADPSAGVVTVSSFSFLIVALFALLIRAA